MKNIVVSGSMQFLDDMRKCAIPIMQKGYSAILPEEDELSRNIERMLDCIELKD